jgi:two-component system, cell cycle sensor histidine kinase and response regulator CckA
MQRADDELRVGEVRKHLAEPGEPISSEGMLARIEHLIVAHKSLEAQLRQSQKMEAVGRLAGGVAHDFNNLLTVITGYAAMLREEEAIRPVLPEIEQIEKAAARAAALTHKLLAFSRKQVLQLQIVSPNAIVSGMEELLRRLIGENIRLVTVLGSGVSPVRADPHQVEQVIMNLAVNARDAMPSGGRLVIETRNVELAAGFRSLRPGRYVVMSVVDSGHGMDEQTAARAFEPFFTTKEKGKGTGLGLSTVYGIVQQSGGEVTVETAPGAGATFRVYLPAAEAADERFYPEPPSASPEAATGTILLVEDEPALRLLIMKTLADAGYIVLEAANAEEAMALAVASRPIDMLLTDVIMPGMSGPDLVAWLRLSRPRCVILYMSGYDNELIDQKTLERTASFLAKPFTPRALLSKIATLLAFRRSEGDAADRAIS